MSAIRYLSLFSGMEAAHLAWAPLGWECVGVAEIDPAPCALLAHRLPHVPNLGSVTDITDEQIAALGRIDVVIGGSPCQDLSVAGNRAGLAGARSGLFHEQLRIFNAARTFCGARWLVWENVPGAFSSNRGRDFAVVAGALAGCELDVPRDGWGNEGVALGPNGLVEWSVLDAQWFGVAQRRRRVFAVLDTGDWAGRPPVLLEPDSLRGDSAPRREAGEGIAGTLTRSAGERGAEDGERGQLVPETCGTLCADTHPGAYTGQDAYTGRLIPEVSHTLRADGFDASEDGTGRGTPLVPVAFDCKSSGQAGFGVGEIASTMRSMGHANSHQNGGGHLAVQQGMQVRRLTPRECERLQDAPDDWTLVPNSKGKPMADGPRYKMLGNSFAVPVITWIGERIQIAHTYRQRAVA
ncbi:DNA cytosine methyltransferase [Stenotrophomonas sp. PS02298]|uniref:DNA cytosine methyltransferase n=1 Tax=Stenotrophomonas sp. PS02298 TaxID=2991424 RepID=UPI002499C8D2|nr:DNA cytosine methyltransferase [Stenotrophomonas sp. PS02298]